MATTSASRAPRLPSTQPPGVAGVLAELVGRLDARSEVGRPVATGRFGADMDVELINDGPVTILMDTATKN